MDLSHTIDLAELLPETAAGKFYEIRRLRDDAAAIQRGLVERMLDARKQGRTPSSACGW